jgi:hypothetical protein
LEYKERLTTETLPAAKQAENGKTEYVYYHSNAQRT